MSEKTRILVADDDSANLTLFAKILRGQGYEVWEASTGQQGLKLAREKRPDLVILDVALPNLSGIELCRRMKADAALSDALILLVSGNAATARDRIKGWEAGADQYLLKPVDPQEFVARIRTLSCRSAATAMLRASEHHYRRLFEILPEAVSLINPQGRVLAANPQAALMLGYSNPVELLSKSVLDLIAPEDHERVRSAIGTALKIGPLRNAGYTVLGKSGRRFPLEVSAAVLRDANHQTVGLVTVGRDISERKRSEKQASAFSTLGYRLSGAIAPEQAARVILDMASELFGWDAGYVDLYSPGENKVIPVLTVDTVRGRRMPVRARRLRLAPTPLMRLVMQKGAQLMTRPNHSPVPVKLVPFGDSRRRSASMMYAPIHAAGAVVGILSIQSYTPQAYSRTDLLLLQSLADHCGEAVQRIKVAEALRQAEAKYRSIFENASEGVFQATPQSRPLSANPALARMLGYQSPEELISSVTHIGRELYVQPARREELMRLLKTEGSVTNFEAAMRRKDGSEIQVSINAHLVRDAEGSILYSEGTNQDITERKRAEQELRQMSARIIEAQEAERLRVARELHDGVNQLIASAKMRLHKVRDRATGLSPAAGEIFARCDRLLAQALEENRRIAQNLRPSDLDEFGLATACRNFLAQVRARTNLAVSCYLSPLGRRFNPEVELNLFRIVQEAITNVEKHARAKTVRVRITVLRDWIVLNIKDDGRGFRPRPAKGGRGKSQGIGLTNMRERAASLGGTCSVVSGPKGGTSIFVRVPVAKPK